jgi:protein TonB
MSGEPSGKADDSLRVYGQMVWASIMAHKPAGIRLRGTVTLTFSLLRDGRLDAAAVSTSGGADSLDQIALAALQDAAPFPPPPEGLSGQSLTFSIPFQFR